MSAMQQALLATVANHFQVVGYLPDLTTAALPSNASGAFSPGGGSPVYSLFGTWPVGVTIDPSTGVVSGTPTVGTYANLGYIATYPDGQRVYSDTFNWTVPASMVMNLDFSGSEGAVSLPNLGTAGGNLVLTTVNAPRSFLSATPHNKSARAVRMLWNDSDYSFWDISLPSASTSQVYTMEAYVYMDLNGQTLITDIFWLIRLNVSGALVGEFKVIMNPSGSPGTATINMVAYGGGGVAPSQTTSFPLSVYNHIAISINAAKLCSMFLNGVLITSGTYTGSLSGDGGVYLENSALQSPSPIGSIDYLRATPGLAYTAPFTPP
jgi:hypothetical protein